MSISIIYDSFCILNHMEWEQKIDCPVKIPEEMEKGDSLFLGETQAHSGGNFL